MSDPDTICAQCGNVFAPPVGLYGTNDCACPHCKNSPRGPCYTAIPRRSDAEQRREMRLKQALSGASGTARVHGLSVQCLGCGANGFCATVGESRSRDGHVLGFGLTALWRPTSSHDTALFLDLCGSCLLRDDVVATVLRALMQQLDPRTKDVLAEAKELARQRGQHQEDRK